MKILLIASYEKPDYLNDMISLQLLTDLDITTDLTSYPHYLFNDLSSTIDIYGKGFTIYKKLSSDLNVSIVELAHLTNLQIQAYDFIVYPSIRRFSNSFHRIAKLVNFSKIIAIDGEDDQLISNKCTRCVYFKRELPYIASCLGILPISFFVPSFCIDYIFRNYSCNLNKVYFLSPCDPRDVSTYVYNTEESYYLQYAKSFFGFTQLKGGWDCLRHYEIILAGCVPLFQKVELMPNKVMQLYPKQLQLLANQLYHSYKDKPIDFNFKFHYQFIYNLFRNFLISSSHSYGSWQLKGLFDNSFVTNKPLNRLVVNFLLPILNIYFSYSYHLQQLTRHDAYHRKRHSLFTVFRLLYLSINDVLSRFVTKNL